MKKTRFIFIFLILSFAACFGGVKKTGKVLSYQDGKVLTKKGFYRVGQLTEAWMRMHVKRAVIVFRNKELGATISTDSFCDDAYDDAQLPVLTKHLLGGIEDIHIMEQKTLMLDGRAALRSVMAGKMDGVPIRLSTVVVKKNECLFDFYLVSSPEKYEQAVSDFKVFYEGFAYVGDD